MVHVRRSLLLIFLVHAVCVWASGDANGWVASVVLLAALSIYLMSAAGRPAAEE